MINSRQVNLFDRLVLDAFMMTYMIQACSNFHGSRGFIINTRPAEIAGHTGVREESAIWPILKLHEQNIR